MPHHAHIQWHAHSVSFCFLNGHDPCTPYFFPFTYAQSHGLAWIYAQCHSLTQIFPNLCCSQQPWKLDTYDSWKNFYDLTSWMMSPVLSWDYEELPWDWQERIMFAPEMQVMVT